MAIVVLAVLTAMAVMVVVIMALILCVVVAAATGIAMLVEVIMLMPVLMVMTKNACGELAFSSSGLLARSALVLDCHRHDLGREHDIVWPPEIVAAQTSGTVEDEEGRCTLHLVCGHCLRDAFAIGLINANRERPLVLAHEDFEGGRCHDIVMLEYGVKGDHCNLLRVEALAKAFGLR